MIVDICVFIGFIVAVIAFGVFMGRGKKDDSEEYFLAGRGLTWWLIGFSLIAANISTEQFVGMSGQAATGGLGLAIASYEWMAAITLVVVAFTFLPKFLSSGIYTIPEFLEHRFNHTSRMLMSISMVIIFIGVTIPSVIYSGAKFFDSTLHQLYQTDTNYIVMLSWGIGILAAIYVAAGGLKACAWADLIQGSALIIGGAIIMVLAFGQLGAAPPESIGLDPNLADAGVLQKFHAVNQDNLHMALPASHSVLPWTALVIGLWIPNFYYWGLNQYIMQRTLGAGSLAQGQKGIVFAAGLKLLIPFIVCVPGLMAFNLFKTDIKESANTSNNNKVLQAFEDVKAKGAEAKKIFPFDGDFAKFYPEKAKELLAFNAAVAGEAVPTIEDLAKGNEGLVKKVEGDTTIEAQTKLIGYDYDSVFGILVGKLASLGGLFGFVNAALFGAVISSLASMLNAASTIFTMDIYKQHIKKDASQHILVWTGRICVIVFVVVGCLIAPVLADPKFKGIFTYIQEFQGFISPGILTIFLFALFIPITPRIIGVVGLLLSPLVYGLLMVFANHIAFLDRMAITVGILIAVCGIITALAPLKEPIKMPRQEKLEMHSSKTAIGAGIAIVAATIALYVIFW